MVYGYRVIGFKATGFRVIGFSVIGFRVIRFRVIGFRVIGSYHEFEALMSRCGSVLQFNFFLDLFRAATSANP